VTDSNGRQKPSRRKRGDGGKTGPAAVVGVGVAAGSLRSLEALFAALGPDLGAAYLVAVRQEEGLGIDAVVEVLSRVSPFGVKLAANGEPLEANHIYVCGPDDLITLHDGHVRTRVSADPVGHRATVDSMLISLAEHAHEHAVAVVLSGLDSDGTAGVTATKRFGGLAIAEELASDVDPSGQMATGPAGIVDLLLPIAEIPKQIALYVTNLREVGAGAPTDDQLAEQLSDEIGRIATILRNVTGNDFHGYKRNTFLRRIQRRMQVVQVDNIDSYIERLRGDREEVQHLFQDLLIGVTQFFRDPHEFEVLERELPRLFEGKGADDQLRVWVLGCATGEEAYSIAILLREHMATLDNPPHVQIFATDLDARALAIARAGRYSDAIAEHITPERLTRWFVKEGDTYCVAKELREMCIFSPHNLVKDAPFSRIDLLSCRNLLIYLNADLQNRVIPIFHFSLRPGGVLFLGPSENVTRHQKLFAPVDRKNRVFRRLDTATRVLPDFPLTPRAHRMPEAQDIVSALPKAGTLTGSISRRADAIAERYAPAYVVIDPQYDVLHFSGRTGRFLEPAAGAASLNLLALVHRDLRLDLRSALHRAAEDRQRIEMPRVPMGSNGTTALANLIVEPIGEENDLTAFTVIFQDAGPASAEGKWDGDQKLVSDEHVQQLESELRLTKERLQTTIEELESTNEELKSSNEEYQSINEELQSANEELETSKEELQSVNEELQTVNGELAHRVGELARTNSDLKNLLESTQIATIFLDNDLRLRNFTPAATDIFHLIETDLGRPIDHLASRVDYAQLQDDVRRVLKTLGASERAISSADGERNYIARILPYRSIDNFIAGAVLTFLDVTSTARAEAALRESEERYSRLFEAIDQGFCIIEVLFDAANTPVDYRFVEVNPAFARQTGLHDAVGKTMRELAPTHEEQWFDFYGRVALTGEPARIEQRARALEGRWYDVYAMRAGDPAQHRVAVLFNDISRRKRDEELQHTLVAELQHRTRNLLAIVRGITQQTLRSSTSLDQFAKEFGDRLSALSRVQSLLSSGADEVKVGDLVRGELDAHGAPLDSDRIIVSGPDVPLTSREVQVLTLALHELTTNAIKYGALANHSGQLSISWSLDRPNGRELLVICWVESGVEMDGVAQQDRRGFGRKLIEQALPYDLGAETNFRFGEDGIRCELRIPIGREKPDGASETHLAR
jgi:two-component system CheB/CheR fusion protein